MVPAHSEMHNQEASWGYTKIRDTWRTGLGIEITRTTVANILAESGIELPPEREKRRQKEFERRFQHRMSPCHFNACQVALPPSCRPSGLRPTSVIGVLLWRFGEGKMALERTMLPAHHPGRCGCDRFGLSLWPRQQLRWPRCRCQLRQPPGWRRS